MKTSKLLGIIASIYYRKMSARNLLRKSSAATTPSKKTILVIDASLPFYDKDSGSNRMLHLLKIFNQLGYHVILFPDSGKAEEPYFTLMQELDIEVIHKVAGSRAWRKKLYQCLDRVDICWLSRPDLNEKYKYILSINKEIKWIYDTVDLHYVRLGREALLLNDHAKRLRTQRSAQKFEVLEVSLAKAADVTIAITETEAVELKAKGAKVVKVVPNIHMSFHGTGIEFSKREGVMFIGGFAHQPNIDAAIWLVNEIMPLVWNSLPDVKVYLVGSHPPQQVLELATDRVVVTGYVHDVSPYFNFCRVFVAPLRYGAGMKGKIGQALEYELPIVSTKIGIEGMNLVNRVNVLEANTTDELNHSIVELYSNVELWQQLHSSGFSALKPLLFDFQKENVNEILSSLNKPFKITIVTVVKNAAATLQNLIDSVAEYKTSEVEFLVWDGQSTDATLQILAENKHIVDQYVSLPDTGIYDAINKATRLAKGRFLLFMGADDLLLEGFTQILPCLKDDRTIYYGGVYMGDKRVSRSYTAYQLTKEHICHQSIIYPSTVFKKYSYDTKYNVFADYHLNLKCWTDPTFKQQYKDVIIARFNTGGYSDFSQDINYIRDKEKWYRELLSPLDYIHHLKRKLGYFGLFHELLFGLKPYSLPPKASKSPSILFINQDFTTDNQPKNSERTFELINMLERLKYEVIFLTSCPYFDSKQDHQLSTAGVRIIVEGISKPNLPDLLSQVEFVWLLGEPKVRGFMKTIRRSRHIKRIFDTSGLAGPDKRTITIAKKSDVTIAASPKWRLQLTSLGIFHCNRLDVETLQIMFNNLR
jgi:glycosyltransferase involved in cell wall biosynthesis